MVEGTSQMLLRPFFQIKRAHKFPHGQSANEGIGGDREIFMVNDDGSVFGFG